MKNKIYFCLLFCVTIWFSGCKSRQTPQKPVENLSVATVNQVLEKQPDFSTMNISKMDVVATYGTQQFSFRATAKLLTDSLLVLSIQPVLGVEMFRVEFTPTDFVLIDKWNRKYTENSYDYLRYKLGIDFSFKLLQDVVSNRLFLLDKEVAADDFVVESFEGEPTRLTHLSEGMIQRFELVEPMSISKAEVLIENARLTCEYGEHRTQNGVHFPMNFKMLIAAGNKNASLVCAVNKIEFNKPIEYTPVNLSRYEKVAFSKIIP